MWTEKLLNKLYGKYLMSGWIYITVFIFNRIVSYRGRRCRLSPLYRILVNYWITAV